MTNKSLIFILPGSLPPSRAVCQNGPDSLEKALEIHFKGIGDTFPDAAFGALSSNLPMALERTWCRLHFIECEADLQTVYAIRDQDMNSDEAQTIFNKFHAYFKQDDHTLYLTPQGEWYLHVANSTDIFTSDLQSIMGKSLVNALPVGFDQRYWHRIFTECQMLLSQLQSKSTLSAVWFDGIGKIKGPLESQITHICTDDSALMGLAQFTNVSTSTLKEGIPSGISGDILVVDRKNKLDLTPYINALSNGDISKITIYNLLGKQFTLTRFSKYCFWRK